jgi:hypothetical protein
MTAEWEGNDVMLACFKKQKRKLGSENGAREKLRSCHSGESETAKKSRTALC